MKLEFLDCRPLTLEKKRKLCKGFFLNIYFFVITSRKVSAVLFLKKKAPLRIFSLCFWNFCCSYFKALSWKDLWQSFVVFQEVEPCILIKKWSHHGQFFVIFGDDIIPAKSLLWIPILVASNNISINKLVHRRYPFCPIPKIENSKISKSVLSLEFWQ